MNEQIDDGGFPVKPQRFVNDVRKVMPADGVIALDNGVYKIWFARNYLAAEPNTVLLDRLSQRVEHTGRGGDSPLQYRVDVNQPFERR